MDGAVGGFNIRMEGDCPSITVLSLSTRETIIITHGKLVLCVENMGQDSLDGLRRD